MFELEYRLMDGRGGSRMMKIGGSDPAVISGIFNSLKKNKNVLWARIISTSPTVRYLGETEFNQVVPVFKMPEIDKSFEPKEKLAQGSTKEQVALVLNIMSGGGVCLLNDWATQCGLTYDITASAIRKLVRGGRVLKADKAVGSRVKPFYSLVK